MSWLKVIRCPIYLVTIVLLMSKYTNMIHSYDNKYEFVINIIYVLTESFCPDTNKTDVDRRKYKNLTIAVVFIFSLYAIFKYLYYSS